jgi:hypothetical protein
MLTRNLRTLAIIAILLSGGQALGQSKEYESPLGLLEGRRKTDWLVHVDAFLNPYIANGAVSARNNGGGYSFNQVLVVYPMLDGASNAWRDPDATEAVLYEDDFVVDRDPELLDGYFLGAKYLLFDAKDVSAYYMHLVVNNRVRAWALEFDETRAREIDWPEGEWPILAETALEGQLFIDPGADEIRNLVVQWVGPTPKSLGPVELAKTIAAHVVNEFQPNGLGFEFNRVGRFAGLKINGSTYAARMMRGTPFDQAALLCAVYRAAGLPARVVTGYDIAASMEGLDVDGLRDRESCQPVELDTAPRYPIIRAWVEFYLYDEKAGAGEWIPVDIERQRGVSSRARPLDQSWQFFGNMPCGDLLIPLAFHFHPPEAVVSPGPPALWGWLAFPNTPRLSQQWIISAMEAPVTAADMP